MAQIIKHGTTSFAWKFTCRKCSSQILATSSDLREGYFPDSHEYNGSGHMVFVKCPICDCRTNFVDPDRLNPELTAMAKAASARERR
jgi:hypothetical protein